MIVYGIIVLTAGIALLTVSILLCFGHIGLLHEYHRDKVEKGDIKKYSLYIGISLLIGAVGMIVAGLLSIIINKDSIRNVVLLITYVPLLISIVLSIIFIKKFNKTII